MTHAKVFVQTPPASVADDALEEIKDHLRLDDVYEDGDVRGYIDAVVAELDGPNGSLKRNLLRQTLVMHADDWYAAKVLGPSDVVSVTSIQYYDADNVLQTLPELDYLFSFANGFDCPSRLQFLRCPQLYCRDDAVIVTYEAGTPSNWAELRANVKQLIKLLVAGFYDQRTSTSIKSISEPAHVTRLRSLLTRKTIGYL